jgi:hypothetical protein
MSRVTETLFASLRGALSGETLDAELLCGLSKEDWQEFVFLSQKHNVLPIVCDGLLSGTQPQTIPRSVSLQLAGLTIMSEDKYAQRVHIIELLAKFFAEHDIPLMILKGYGVSLYYPKPNHRVFSDVDIYNFGQLERADKLVAEKLHVKVSNDVHHHTTFVLDGVLVENHYNFVNTSAHRSNNEYERILKEEASKNYTEHFAGEHLLRLPSPKFNALFLMRHMALHYAAERISVRHLCDWKQFIEHEGDRIDWQSVNALYARFNMKRFADAITNICIEHLGMKPNIVHSTTSDRALEERIVNDILDAEFDEPTPKGAAKIIWWKIRRYMANRWKHELIYNESWMWTFFCSAYSHLLKPKTIIH